MHITAGDQDKQRRVLEARARLREGFTTRAKVDELVIRVAKKRGQHAADQLREDMRAQWKIRHEWVGAATGPPPARSH
jgi:hypothetical protein